MNQRQLQREFTITAHPKSLESYQPIELVAVLIPLLLDASQSEDQRFQRRKRRWLRPIRILTNINLIVVSCIWLLLMYWRVTGIQGPALWILVGVCLVLLGTYTFLERLQKRIKRPTPHRRWFHVHDSLSVVLKNQPWHFTLPEAIELACACLLLHQSDSPFVPFLAQRLTYLTPPELATLPTKTHQKLRELLELPNTPPLLLTTLLLTLENDPLARPSAVRLENHHDPKVREAAAECLRGTEASG